MELPSSRDIKGIIFVGGSAFFILFGIIEALWILGSKKVMDMGVLRNIDTGRGIFAFGLFLIITIFAPFIDGFLSLGSVSYTHLDVYKRQSLNTASYIFLRSSTFLLPKSFLHIVLKWLSRE